MNRGLGAWLVVGVLIFLLYLTGLVERVATVASETTEFGLTKTVWIHDRNHEPRTFVGFGRLATFRYSSADSKAVV